jgi:uncharacterized protein (DUF1330 family)
VPAYVVANVEIHDPERYRDYTAETPGSIARHGGRFVARAGRTEVLEGDWPFSRLVILEFPTYEQAKAWFDSGDYQDLRRIRLESADSLLVLVDGAPAVGVPPDGVRG